MTSNKSDNVFVGNVKTAFHKGFDRVPLLAKSIYKVEYKGPGVGDIFRVDELDPPGLASRFNEGEDVPNAVIRLGYSKNIQVYRVGQSVPVTWHLRYHNKYAELMESVRRVGEVVAERMELDMTHRLSFFTVTSYTDRDGTSVTTTSGDGLALGSTAHTITGSSSTFRNRIANNPALSTGSLESAESIGQQQMIDNSGRRTFPRYDTIVVGTDATQQNVAFKIVNSLSPMDESNSGVANPYQRKYKVLILKYLDSLASGAYDSTKNKYWALVDTSNPGLYLKITENPHITAPTPGGNGENFWNENWTFKATATYGIESLEPRFAILSTGDGVA